MCQSSVQFSEFSGRRRRSSARRRRSIGGDHTRVQKSVSSEWNSNRKTNVPEQCSIFQTSLAKTRRQLYAVQKHVHPPVRSFCRLPTSLAKQRMRSKLRGHFSDIPSKNTKTALCSPKTRTPPRTKFLQIADIPSKNANAVQVESLFFRHP